VTDKFAATPPPSAARTEMSGYDILVLDAGNKQSLASVQSLGQAGLRVAVGESLAECGLSRPPLAFRSRYSARNLELPPMTGSGQEFGDAVVEFVRQHPTRVILPTGDSAIGILRSRREELAALGCTLALASNAALDIANDKDRTLALAASLGIAYPRTMRIDSLDGMPAMLAEFGFPFVIKPTSSWTEQSTDRLYPVDVVNEAEAFAIAEKILAAGAGVLAQQWACGLREGVSLFVVDGEILASCAHVAHRTNPALGGVSVMRESIPIQPDIYDSSVSLVKAIGLTGPCEVEFRRDAANQPLLMEVNARLAGTIENAVHSGVDFPQMIWRWATGAPVERCPGYQTGVRTRWLRGELRWLRDNRGRYGRPDTVSQARALWIFGSEFLKTHHYDGIDPHDLGPSALELWTMIRAARKPRDTQSSAKNLRSKGVKRVD
jgi:glutathione synthase/RimK-type ligase-like ATP-grasp enzyme